MKILVKNSDVVFQKATVIEFSYTKTFEQSEVGGQALITIPFENPVKPNMKMTVLISGDTGVVTNNVWTKKLNGQPVPGSIERGVSSDIRINGVVDSLSLQRDTLAAAGTVNVSVKYYDDSMYVPEVIGGDVEITAGAGSQTFNFNNSIVGPGLVKVKATARSGVGFYSLKISALSSESSVVATKDITADGNDFSLYFSSDIKSVKVEAPSGVSTTDTFAVTITH